MSSPLDVSIQTSLMPLSAMRFMSALSDSTNLAFQNGWSIHEPQNSCRNMPGISLSAEMRLSMRCGECFEWSGQTDSMKHSSHGAALRRSSVGRTMTYLGVLIVVCASPSPDLNQNCEFLPYDAGWRSGAARQSRAATCHSTQTEETTHGRLNAGTGPA